MFDDEKFVARFLDLPFSVFKRILKRPRIRRVDAVRLMLAFAVAQSTEAPLRPENQAKSRTPVARNSRSRTSDR